MCAPAPGRSTHAREKPRRFALGPSGRKRAWGNFQGETRASLRYPVDPPNPRCDRRARAEADVSEAGLPRTRDLLMSDRSPEDHESAPEEKRLHRRTPFRALHVRGESKRLFFSGYVRNLSVGGLFLQTTKPKPVGMKLRLHIPLERELPPLECAAEVVWVQPFDVRSNTPPGMGLHFTDLEARSAHRIGAFLARTEERAGG